MEYSRDRYVPSSSIEDIDASVLKQRSALQRLLPPANHFSAHETFDIGRNEGMPVNREYEDKGTFIFTEGQLHDVIVDIA